MAEYAKEDMYFVTGNTFWMVHKGDVMPSRDSILDAKALTEEEYKQYMRTDIPWWKQ